MSGGERILVGSLEQEKGLEKETSHWKPHMERMGEAQIR